MPDPVALVADPVADLHAVLTLPTSTAADAARTIRAHGGEIGDFGAGFDEHGRCFFSCLEVRGGGLSLSLARMEGDLPLWSGTWFCAPDTVVAVFGRVVVDVDALVAAILTAVRS